MLGDSSFFIHLFYNSSTVNERNKPFHFFTTLEKTIRFMPDASSWECAITEMSFLNNQPTIYESEDYIEIWRKIKISLSSFNVIKDQKFSGSETEKYFLINVLTASMFISPKVFEEYINITLLIINQDSKDENPQLLNIEKSNDVVRLSSFLTENKNAWNGKYSFELRAENKIGTLVKNYQPRAKSYYNSQDLLENINATLEPIAALRLNGEGIVEMSTLHDDYFLILKG